ncbi:MAG: helix-turn-helix transcriptional regulator [Bacteroidia bacterium]
MKFKSFEDTGVSPSLLKVNINLKSVQPAHPEKNPEFSQIPEELLRKLQTLTFREKEILSMVATGRKSSEIAVELFISKHTVDTHRRHIISKLKITSILDWQRAAEYFYRSAY